MGKNNYCNKLLTIVISLMILTMLCSCSRNDSIQGELPSTDSTDESVTDTTNTADDSQNSEVQEYDISQYKSNSKFLTVMYNDNIYYYCGNLYDSNEVEYYISMSEYIGVIETCLDEEEFVSNNFESNFIAAGRQLYIYDDYMIAVLENPSSSKGNPRISYAQILIRNPETDAVRQEG